MKAFTQFQKIMLFAVLPILLIFCIEPLYRDSLYQKTLDEVPRMQLKKRLYGFFQTITFLGEAEICIIMLVFIFNLTNKLKALYIWAAFGFICYLNVGVLKNLYSQPRPFWVSENINPQKCRKDFGNPSGHSMTASFFWLTVYLHKYHEVGAIKKFNSVFCTEYIVKMMLTVGMVLFFIFLAVSRVFLGEHSYNQVFFGTQLGVALAAILHYFIKPVVKKFPAWAREKYGI